MKRISEPRPADFGGLAVLSLCWGSAFLFIEIALESFGPLSIAAGRITIGAVFLTAIVLAGGHRLPGTLRDWGILFLAAITGATIPFSLISWGQSQISSSMAAILMSFTPLATVILAQFMTPDERLTGGKLLGVGLGTAGVILLVGEISGEALNAGLLGKLAVLGGGVGYALSSLLLRRASGLPTTVGAAGVMLAGAVTILPLALIFERPFAVAPSMESFAALVFLGIFPSAVAVIVLVWLLGRVGVTFVALNNYLVPAVGTALGVIFLGEQLLLQSVGGLLLILAGVLVTRLAQRRDVARLARGRGGGK